MTKNMIKAVIKMLKDNPDPKVQCAVAVLEELVEGIEVTVPPRRFLGRSGKVSDEGDVIIEGEEGEEEVIPAKPKTNPHTEAGYEILADNGTLVSIRNYPLTSKVELDGKVMTHAEAIGKSFKRGRLVD